MSERSIAIKHLIELSEHYGRVFDTAAAVSDQELADESLDAIRALSKTLRIVLETPLPNRAKGAVGDRASLT